MNLEIEYMSERVKKGRELVGVGCLHRGHLSQSLLNLKRERIERITGNTVDPVIQGLYQLICIFPFVKLSRFPKKSFNLFKQILQFIPYKREASKGYEFCMCNSAVLIFMSKIIKNYTQVYPHLL